LSPRVAQRSRALLCTDAGSVIRTIGSGDASRRSGARLSERDSRGGGLVCERAGAPQRRGVCSRTASALPVRVRRAAPLAANMTGQRERLSVTVVIPCFNQSTFLAAAVASVRAQSYDRVACLVVDDGSTDKTSAVASSLDVPVLEQPNRGVSAAR